jgi:hypothetical protein
LSGAQTASGGSTAVPVTAVAKAVAFSPAEQAVVEACCAGLELTPRSIKRFINVLKLIKLIWNRSYRGPQPVTVTGAVALLLALSARYPELMRGVFESLWQSSRSAHPRRLDQLLQEYELAAADTPLAGDRDSLVRDVARLTTQSVLTEDETYRLGHITLADLGSDNFNLTRSFSFVGDVGSDGPEPKNHS